MKKTNQKHTNKQFLIKGLKRLLIALPLLVLTTYIFTFAFINKETISLYLLLPLAFAAMAATIYLLFNGIKWVLRSLFGKNR